MHILKEPDLNDPKLRAKLAKGMGHNYYGGPPGRTISSTSSRW